MKEPSIFEHLRDVIMLPFMVTGVIPYLIYDSRQILIPDMLILKITGIFFIAIGLFLFILTNYLFKTIGKGTLAPWTEKQKLVIRGPYKYCRNPMITGVIFILAGEALSLHSTNILIWSCTVFVVNVFYFVFKEEPDLYKRFGEEYKRYKNNVPRWIPKLRPYSEAD